VRLPKAQVQKLVEESKDEAEVAEKIIDLYMDNSGEANGEHDHNRHVQWQPELGSITESFKTTKVCVSCFLIKLIFMCCMCIAFALVLLIDHVNLL
jgi:hypothetical protein